MDQTKADAELTKVTRSLETLYDNKAVVDELRWLVLLHSVSGKSVHDTCIVATMNVNSVSHLLTINVRDFTRFPGLHLLDPRAQDSVTASSSPHHWEFTKRDKKDWIGFSTCWVIVGLIIGVLCVVARIGANQ